MRRPFFAIALTLAHGAMLLGQPAAPGSDRTALVNANVVDVVAGTVQEGQTLVLAGGRIQSIGTAAPPATSGAACRPLEVTTGVPQLIASTIGMPNPSYQDGSARHSAAE